MARRSARSRTCARVARSTTRRTSATSSRPRRRACARGAKANHLAYLGDGDIGEDANVGAGTIFCNYDGFQKHKTTIGTGAFIGSDSQLVAPVRSRQGRLRRDRHDRDQGRAGGRPRNRRAKQENKEGYAKRLRGRLAAAAGKADPARAPDTVKTPEPAPPSDGGSSLKRA